MPKLRIKRNDIIKEINVTDDKEQASIPYIRFKRDLKEYYSNLKLLEGHIVSEASSGCFVIDGRIYVISDKSKIDDNATHIMGIILTEEGNGGTWVRVNDKLETVDFDPNNGIYKNIQEIENNRHGKLIEIPPVYVKTETFTEGEYEGKTCWWIADYPADGFHIHPAFIDEDGNPSVLRIAKDWDFKSDYDYSDSNDPDNPLNKWQSEGIRAYSIYDHHVLARLMLIEFGTPDVYDFIKTNRENEDDEFSYHSTTNYRGINDVLGYPDDYTQYKLAGIYASSYDTIKVWKNNGSLEFYDTELELTDGNIYPLTTFTDKFDDVDMGDIFIGKDTITDDNLSWDERPGASTFKANQSFYGDIYLCVMYPGMFNLDGIHDMSEAYRFVQVETVLDKINIKRVPETINITEYYGVPFDQIKLPDKVTVTLEDDSTKNSSVIWDGNEYDPMSPGSQMIEAEILLNGRIKNDNGYKATANITVEDMPELTVKNINYYSRDKISAEKWDMKRIPRENIKDLTNVKIEPDASYAFESCYALEEFPPTYFNTWDTSEVTNMSYMFKGIDDITDLDLSHFNTSNLTDINNMFNGCRNLKNLNISNWDTSNITNFKLAFYNCSNLESPDIIENLNINSAVDISGMLEYTKFKTLDLSNWNTSNVKTVSDLFMSNSSLEELDLTGWDTSNVSSFSNMFYSCSSLKNIKGIEGFTISNIDDTSYNYNGVSYMFNYCYFLESLNLSGWTKDSNKLKNLNGTFSGCTRLSEITGIENWDVSNVTEMLNTFYNCKVLTADLSNWNTQNLTKMSSMFSNCDLDKLTGWNNFNTSKITDMRSIFSGCKAPIIDNKANLIINGWDTSKVTDMSYMFSKCDASIIDISNLNVYSVRNMSYMFDSCENLNELNIPSNFFTNRNVRDFSYMFRNCKSMPTVFPYIIDIGIITDYYKLQCMFLGSSVREVTFINANASVKKELEKNPWRIGHNNRETDGFIIHFIVEDLGNFDLHNYAYDNIPNSWKITELPQSSIDELTNIKPKMNASYAFNQCYKLTTMPPVETWDTSLVVDMSQMFSCCEELDPSAALNLNFTKVNNMSNMFDRTKLTSLDLTKVNSLQNVTKMVELVRDCDLLTTVNMHNLDTPKLQDINFMFWDCDNLVSVDAEGMNTSAVTNMEGLFGACPSLTSLDLSSWDTSNVTSMRDMFYNCRSLTSFGIENWNVSKVKNMEEMFATFPGFTSPVTYLNLSNWNTASLENMKLMFNNATKLQSIDMFTNTSNVTNMNGVFYNNYSLQSMDLHNWDTSKVTNMSEMFQNCSSITSVNMSGINIGNVTNLRRLFFCCKKLSSIPGISNINVEKVTDFYGVFYGCETLGSLDLSRWNVSNATNMYGMFERCSNLSSLNISTWTIDKVEDTGFMFSNCNKLSSINMPNFSLKNVKNASHMFSYNPVLTSINIDFDTSSMTDMSSMFFNCTKLPANFPYVIDCSSITNTNSLDSLDNMFTGSSVRSVTLKNVKSELRSGMTPYFLSRDNSFNISFI